MNFRLTIDDLASIDEWLQSHGGALLVQPQPSSDVVASPNLDPVRLVWPVGTVSHQFLARNEDMPMVRTRYVESQWLVAPRRSPVVEFLLMEVAGTRGAVARGRFYFRTTFVDQTGNPGADHPVQFVHWADSLLRWARRAWTKVDGIYLSRSAAAQT